MVSDAVDYMKKLFPDASITIGDDPVRTLPYLTISRIREELGFQPEYTMEKGMKDYVDILLGHRGPE